MQKSGDSLKIGIWVSAGLVAGALIMFGIQSVDFNLGGHAPKKTSEAPAPEPANLSSADSGESQASLQSKSADSSNGSQAEKKLKLVPCPNPVSAAMAQLNTSPQATIMQVQAGAYPSPQGVYVIQAPVQGTPIAMQAQGAFPQGQTVIVNGPYPPQGDVIQQGPYQQVSGLAHGLAPLPVGRNGLLANPCVDPPSVHGVAYSKGY